MSLEKTAKAMGDWRTIWVGILALISVAAWAGDTRWMLKTGGAAIATKIQVELLLDQIAELELQKVYVDDPQKLKMLQALINIKTTKINSIKK